MDVTKPEPVQKLRHDLRTPIATINWFCELLKDSKTGPLTTKQEDCINEILSASQKMLKSVNKQIQKNNLRKILNEK